MTSSSEFFIHLPSNACPSIYPLNTASNYSIQLNEPIQLDNSDKWTVALNDISYTTDLKTIEHETIRCGIPHVKKKYHKHIHQQGNEYLWKWSYYDIGEIISAYPVVDKTNKGEFLYKLCAKLMSICTPKSIVFGFYRRKHEDSFWTDVPLDDSTIQFDAYAYKIQIDIRKPNIFIQFPDQIVKLMGFRQRKSFYKQQAFTAHMDSTEPIESITLDSRADSKFIMDKLHPFLQSQQHVLKRAGQVLSIQELVDSWRKVSAELSCQLHIGEDGRASVLKSSSTNIIYIDDKLLAWLRLYDQVLSLPALYTNPDCEPLNLNDLCEVDDKEWVVQVYDINLSTVDDSWMELNKCIIDMPSRSYRSPTELLLDLNAKLQLNHVDIQIEQDTLTKKVRIKIAPYYFMMIESRLQQMLGFKTQSTFSSGSHVSDDPINLQQPHIRTMSVYTNIIDYVHVGSQMEQLLRTFLHEDNGERMLMKEFVHNIYVPVRETCISCIKILIFDENFHEIPFHNGKTMVTLHFKRCR